jgi:hypothetical protein
VLPTARGDTPPLGRFDSFAAPLGIRVLRRRKLEVPLDDEELAEARAVVA